MLSTRSTIRQPRNPQAQRVYVSMYAMSGLFSKSADLRVPLKAVAVTGRVDGFFCQVTVEQTYENDGAAPIEAVYRFPLPEGAAVSGFEVEVAGRRVVGAVREKEAAAEEYARALARGGGGYLLEEESPEIFTASVGNLPPGGRCALRVTYAAELPCGADGVVRFSLPTTVAPRYAPASPRAGGGGGAAPDVQPLAVAADVPYRMSAALEVEMPSDLAAVASPSHPAALQVEMRGRRARVRLSRDQPLDGAVVLQIAQREPHAARAWAERGPDGTCALAVALCPEWGDEEEARGEYLFLVDRSGSMRGAKIEQSRNALQLMLRSLPVGSRFNLLGFGSRFVRLFEESRDYGDASAAAAAAHVSQIQADLGGTELLLPLEAVFAGPPDPLFPRQVFILTDGEVSNTEQVIRLVRRHAAEARVFSVGIGSGASEHLVRGVARAGGGQAEFIGDGERVEGAVLRQLRRAAQPSLAAPPSTGAARRPAGPARPPPLLPGDRLVVAGGARRAVGARAGGAGGGARVAAGGAGGGAGPAGGQQRAARARRALLAGRTEAEVAAGVLGVALRHGLASSRTAFVAVEERPGAAPASEPMRLALVPALLPRDEAPERFAVGHPMPICRRSAARPPDHLLASAAHNRRAARCKLALSSASFAVADRSAGGLIGARKRAVGVAEAAAQGERPGLFEEAGFDGIPDGVEVDAGAEGAWRPPPARRARARGRGGRGSGGATRVEAEQQRRQASSPAAAAGFGALAGAATFCKASLLDGPDANAGDAAASSLPSALHLQLWGAGGERPHDSVLLLQGATGPWELNEALAGALGRPLAALAAATPCAPQPPAAATLAPPKFPAQGGAGGAPELWATALALAFLEARCRAAREEWELSAGRGGGRCGPASPPSPGPPPSRRPSPPPAPPSLAPRPPPPLSYSPWPWARPAPRPGVPGRPRAGPNRPVYWGPWV
eukprot:tig00000981_g5867.t1